MMKYFTLLKSFLYLVLLLSSPFAFSQNVGVNSSGSAPDASAGLDVSFSDKGLLIPRIALTSTTDVTTIASPATSLLVYNTAIAGTAPNDVTPGYYYFNGSTWLRLSTNTTSSQWTTNGSNVYYTGGNVGIGVSNPTYKLHVDGTSNPLFLGGVENGSTSDSVLTITNGLVKKLPQNGLLTTSWGLNGNTASSSNFIGTTNKENINFKANNTQAMLIDSLGNVGIGSAPVFNATAKEKLLVDVGGSQASPVSSYNGFVVKGYNSSYLQINVQNRYNGTGASTDIVATANNGSETNNFIDMGINSGSNSGSFFGGANDAYLYNRGQDLLIGTASSNKSIQFLTGGGDETTNERMRISGSGNVGIGTTNPSYKLHIVSDSNPLYLSGVQTDSSPEASLTISGGIVKKTNLGWFTGGNNISSEQNFGTITNHALPIITNDIERMRITSSGDVTIGTDTPEDGSLLTVNGGITCYDFFNNSDRRLKKNIQNLNYGLKDLVSLQPVTYNWIDPKQTDKTQIGLIAQDLIPIIPELVNGDEEKGKLSVNYVGLVPVLINAIKEQQSKLDAQQKQIDELKELVQKSLSNK